MLTDFNCKILDINRYKFYLGDKSVLSIEAQRLVDDINILGACGFHNLIHQIKADPTSPFHVYKKAASKIIQYVKKETAHKLTGKFSVQAVPVIYLTEETPFIKTLDNFTAFKSNYIFLELPYIDKLSDQLFVALNHLLYKRHLLPVFTDIQRIIGIYSEIDINRIINIKGAAFQFTLNYIHLSRNIDTIKHILNNGGLVLLGTSCEHSYLNKSEIEKCLSYLKKQLGDDEYMNLIIKSRSLLQ